MFRRGTPGGPSRWPAGSASLPGSADRTRRWVRAKDTEHPLLLPRKVFAGELEGGRDAPVVSPQLLESVPVVGHSAHPVRQGPLGSCLEPDPRDPQGERQPSQSRTSSRAVSGSRSTRSVPTRLPSRRRPSRSGRGSREIRPVASRPASRRRLLTMTALPGPDGSSGRTCWASSASSGTAADACEAPGCAFVPDARDHRSMSGDDPLAPPGKGGWRSRSGSAAGDAVLSARPSGSSARRRRGRP